MIGQCQWPSGHRCIILFLSAHPSAPDLIKLIYTKSPVFMSNSIDYFHFSVDLRSIFTVQDCNNTMFSNTTVQHGFTNVTITWHLKIILKKRVSSEPYYERKRYVSLHTWHPLKDPYSRNEKNMGLWFFPDRLKRFTILEAKFDIHTYRRREQNTVSYVIAPMCHTVYEV